MLLTLRYKRTNSKEKLQTFPSVWVLFLVGVWHERVSWKGEDLRRAGRISIKNGKIEMINNLSGHYTPSPFETKLFPELFIGVGLEVSGAKLEVWGLEKVSSSYISDAKLLEIITIP